MLLTSPMTFSSSAMRAWVPAMRWAFFFSSERQAVVPEPVREQGDEERAADHDQELAADLALLHLPDGEEVDVDHHRRILLTPRLVPGAAEGQPDRHRRHRRHVHDEARIEPAAVDLDVLERVQDLHRHAHPRSRWS